MSTLRKARENVSDEGAIGFSFASDWLGPITERSKAKSKQFWVTFDFWELLKEYSLMLGVWTAWKK